MLNPTVCTDPRRDQHLVWSAKQVLSTLDVRQKDIRTIIVQGN